MESIQQVGSSVNTKTIYIGVAIGLFIVGLTYVFIKYSKTRPLIQGFAATNGTSSLPCGQESSEAEKLMGLFLGRDVSHTENGAKDLDNLKNLLSKLTCFKRDLVNPGSVISASKEVQFNTYSDIQNLADTTAQCFAAQIPERDLSIQFDKWEGYGKDLILRLCTAADLHEKEVDDANEFFIRVISDVKSIARDRCFRDVRTPYCSPRDAAPMMTKDVKNLNSYSSEPL
jgi:hypothetical protein